jgi:hypothetical protein
MSKTNVRVRSLQAQRPLVAALEAAWAAVWARVSKSYRPERHYMREPGPKARAKRAG